ncbi:protein FANTASTIC FOUR 1 [Prosopis cineraria]|uniref:protein FANTASTIC FOUR 1 n=1 Tax=Prosopis cineraria TaxID=364024 RepID=UPI0024100C10|nr:protein FANTASTIC FOUR 1 [Prosopis cineraria]
MTIFSQYLPFILFLSLSFPFFFSFILPSLHHHQLLLRSFIGFSGGLGLGLAAAITLVMVKKPPHPVQTDAPLHNVGGLVADELESCTKSLGFESYHEGRLMDRLEIDRPAEDSRLAGTAADIGAKICTRTSHRVRKEVRSFPPPLSSLNLNGRPSFFLRPVRKDGRLKLTEVRIHWPEILHAWRHNGRLTLHLIPDDSALDDLEDDGEEEEPEEDEELEEGKRKHVIKKSTDDEQAEEIVKAITDEEEEFRFRDWKFGKEGLRRYHQVLNDHGSHDQRLHNHPLQLQMRGVSIA